MEEHPFPTLHITSPSFLDDIDGRQPCTKCGRSRKYYCYTCYKPIKELEDRLPLVQLPINVDIIKHPRECDGKSTSAHAAILAPSHVRIFTYPDIPTFKDESKVLLVFPGQHAKTFDEFLKSKQDTESKEPTSQINSQLDIVGSGEDNNYEEHIIKNWGFQSGNSKDQCHSSGISSSSNQPPSEKLRKLSTVIPFDHVVFVDCTWNQTKRIVLDERLENISQVVLTERTTKFWRHQRGKPETYLATIEAIYYFMVDFHKTFLSSDYKGEYDNLLFFFVYMYRKIRSLYKDDITKLKAYRTRGELES